MPHVFRNIAVLLSALAIILLAGAYLPAATQANSVPTTSYLDNVQFDTHYSTEIGHDMTTFLRDEYEANADTSCVDLSAMSATEIQEQVERKIGVERSAALQEAALKLPASDAIEEGVMHFCVKDDTMIIVALAPSLDEARTWTVEWADGEAFIRRLQDVNAIATWLEWHVYYSPALERFVVASLYGDAGIIEWHFTALDTSAYTSDLVETCVTHDDFETGTHGVLECAREYIDTL